MTPQERAEKHWDGYVGPMQRELLAHMVEVCMAMSRFHYVTSHVHGVKHAEQDARETARAAFTPVQEEVDEWVTKDLCRRCEGEDCEFAGKERHIVNCPSFVSAPVVADKPSFPFTFPPALKWMGKSETEYDEKLIEEVDEVIKAKDSRERMMELLDVLHVVETAVRTLAEKTGLDPAAAIVEVIRKNSARNYYQG